MSEEDGNQLVVGFDYSHNNNLTIEGSSFADFTHFLFSSSYKLGKIVQGLSNIEKISKYNLFIIGGAVNKEYSPEEIEVLTQYVKDGGSLLMIHGEGGDYEFGTNLNDITENFGFTYNNDVVSDSMNYIANQKQIKINKLEPHIIADGVDTIVMSKPCSISINKALEADNNVEIIPLVKTGFNSYRNIYDMESGECSDDEDAPKTTLAVYVRYHKGKVIGLPTVTQFSSLSSAYGYPAFENKEFVSNIFKFLLAKGDSTDFKLIHTQLNFSISMWCNRLVNEEGWRDVDSIINFSLKYFKDNYRNIMKGLDAQKKRLNKQLKQLKSKIKDKKELIKREEEIKSEIEIYDAVERDEQSIVDLQSIMNGLSEVTSGVIKTRSKDELMAEVADIERKIEEEVESDEDDEIESEELDETSEVEEAEEDVDNSEADEEDSEEDVDDSEEDGEGSADDDEEDLEEPKELSPEELKELSAFERAKKIAEQRAKAKDPNAEPEPEVDEFEGMSQFERAKAIAKKRAEETDEIDDALAELGSFDDFKKKIKEFNEITEDKKDKKKE